MIIPDPGAACEQALRMIVHAATHHPRWQLPELVAPILALVHDRGLASGLFIAAEAVERGLPSVLRNERQRFGSQADTIRRVAAQEVRKLAKVPLARWRQCNRHKQKTPGAAAGAVHDPWTLLDEIPAGVPGP